jgi:hypothetical protein
VTERPLTPDSAVVPMGALQLQEKSDVREALDAWWAGCSRPSDVVADSGLWRCQFQQRRMPALAPHAPRRPVYPTNRL